MKLIFPWTDSYKPDANIDMRFKISAIKLSCQIGGQLCDYR